MSDINKQIKIMKNKKRKIEEDIKLYLEEHKEAFFSVDLNIIIFVCVKIQY